MQLIEKSTVLEDGVEIGTFDTYEQAVDHIRKHAVKGRKYRMAKEFVTTEDEPLLTIADTGWKEEYKGMWADVDGFENPQLITLGTIAFNDVLVSDFQNPRMGWVKPAKVCPRYDLARVSLTPHPAYLETLKDYEGAPAHTVITCSWEGTSPDLVKNSIGEWVSVGEYFFDSSTKLAGTRRKVLYWPEVEEQ